MAKILLVEDDLALREIFETRLTAAGHQVLTANNGKEGLEFAAREKPELVVADIIMPELSGFEMIAKMRQDPQLKDTKVIMVTALNQPEDRQKGEQLGVLRYIAKSEGTPDDYLKVVQEVLGNGPQPGPQPQAPLPTTPAADQ